MSEIKKIIIATDNGDDIDDLLTLYFALSQKNIEIVGITTTYMNTNLRARQINKVLKLANKTEIPVYAGIGRPLKSLHPGNTEYKYCQYTPDLDDDIYKPINDSEGCNGESAVDFIIKKSEELKEDLTIVCIGPLTNLASAVLKATDVLKKPSIVMMGGCFSKIEREWNIACDYEAANIVFNSKLNLTAIGVDVTKKTEITLELQERILSHNTKDAYQAYLIEAANLWFNATKRRIVLHDPLTLYYICNPNIFSFKEYHICVEKQGEYTTALTVPLEELLWVQFAHVDKSKYSITKCAIDVSSEEFISDFVKQLDL